MFQYLSYILITYMVCGLCGVHATTTCPPLPTYDPLHEKGEVCLVELGPVLEHIANKKEQLWSSGDEGKLNETRKQLVRIEGLEVETKDQLKAFQKKIETELKALETKMPTTKIDFKGLEIQVQEAQKALHLSMEGMKVIRRNEIPYMFKKFGYSYYYIEKKVTADWFTATSNCHKMGGHLATLENDAELNAIHKEVDIRERIWLGITDLAKWGDWVSLATGKTPIYLKWAPRNPEAKIDQRCIYLEGGMKDGRCNQTYIYICEY